MPVRSLTLRNVGPFSNAEFRFDSNVNVFVGPNNSGKTTALLALAEFLIFPFEIPPKIIRKGSSFCARIAVGSRSRTIHGTFPIEFTGRKGNWTAKAIHAVEKVIKSAGFVTFIPAIRLTTDFRSSGPASKPKPSRGNSNTIENLRPQIPNPLREWLTKHTTAWLSDTDVVEKIVNLDYQAYRENRPNLRRVINDIGGLASEITEGFPLAFVGVGEDSRGLYPKFRTPDGELSLDVLSQGTQSLVQWLTKLLLEYSEFYDYPDSLAHKPGILIIDEIDAHLHPSWQRRILPTLSKRFPSLQVFCSTHSPLMLTGLEQGQVQLLTRHESGGVTVSQNDSDIKGWTADEVYTHLLEIKEPTDIETEGHLRRLEALRKKQHLTKPQRQEAKRIRGKLETVLREGPTEEDARSLAKQIREHAKEAIRESSSNENGA